MGIYVKKYLISTLYLSFWFSNMILSHAWIFTSIAASKTASDDVTN